MAKIKWDLPTERIHQRGVDQGIIQVGDGDVVPWNGLSSAVYRDRGGSIEEYYFEGQKYRNKVNKREGSIDVEAFTYPKEFEAALGIAPHYEGFYFSDQDPEIFNFSYRTLQFNGVSETPIGYKIHLYYGCSVLPAESAANSTGGEESLDPFSWTIYPMPVTVLGFNQVSRFTLDSLYLDPRSLKAIEDELYGNSAKDAKFLKYYEIANMLPDWDLRRASTPY